MLFIIILIASIILIILFCKNGNSIENYGQMKNFRRIPKNECYNICSNNYGLCMNQFQHIDAGSCTNKYQSCMSVCNYTDYHIVN
jgi:hypothetical protein